MEMKENEVDAICIAFGLLNSSTSSCQSSSSSPFVDVILDYDEYALLSGMGIHQTPVGVVNPDLEAFKNLSELFKIRHAKHVKPSKVHSLDMAMADDATISLPTRSSSCAL